MSEITNKPENKSDIEQRAKQFNAELIPLLAKYKVGLTAKPIILPDGRLAAQPQLFDDISSDEKKNEVEPKAESSNNGLAAA